MEKVAIFVDVRNIYYTSRDRYQRHFNYSEFWPRATDGKQHGFQQILKNIGFTVKLKPDNQRPDGSAKGVGMWSLPWLDKTPEALETASLLE